MVAKKFPGNFSSLAKVADFVTPLAEKAGLSDQEVYQVALAVDEACANIIDHAYGGEGIGDIYCECNVLSDGLEIILIDQGNPFDPDKIPEPKVGAPLEELGSRGAGLFLIKKVMDEVHFDFSKEKGTTLFMTKRKSG